MMQEEKLIKFLGDGSIFTTIRLGDVLVRLDNLIQIRSVVSLWRPCGFNKSLNQLIWWSRFRQKESTKEETADIESLVSYLIDILHI